jgi:heat shock protein HslJ
VVEIGGTAVVVAAVAIGATLVATDHGHGRVNPAGQTPPTQRQLLGHWQLRTPHGSLSKTGPNKDPNLVTFTMDQSQLMWSGYDGCSWYSGKVDLGAGGSFATPNAMVTLNGCLGISGKGGPLITGVRVIERARSVGIEGTDLTFYNSEGHPVGTFGRVGPPTSTTLPGTAPSQSDLVGRWHWVTKTPPSHRGTHMDPSFLLFTFHPDGLMPPAHPGPILHWSGYGGCNNFVTGDVHLASQGAFSTSRNIVSDLACTIEPPPGEVEVSGVIGRAHWVRLVGERLQFYDAQHHLVGVFEPVP